MKRFNSGLRKFADGGTGLGMPPANAYPYVDPMTVQPTTSQGGTYDFGQGTTPPITGQQAAGGQAPNLNVGAAPSSPGAGANASAIGTGLQTANSLGLIKGQEGQALSSLTGLAASSGSAAAAPLLGVLAAQQGAKAIAGDTDEFGVYDSDIKAGFGGAGNVIQTFKTGQEMQENNDRYAYLSGRSKSDVDKAARLSKIPLIGGIAGSYQQNEIREAARDRALALNRQASNFEQQDTFANSQDYSRSKYGATFANGGNIEQGQGFFKAGGSTHENGGVNIGSGNEIEKDEVVFDGNVYSDRLYVD